MKQPAERRQHVGADCLGGRPPVRRRHVLPHLLPPPHRPFVDAAEPPIRRRAVEPDVHVIVVDLGVARLLHDERRARHQRRIVAFDGRLVQQRRRERTMNEDPLNLVFGIAQQRAHERPVAARIEPHRRHGRGRRPDSLGGRPAHGAAVRSEVKHRLAGRHRPPVAIHAVEEDVDVAAALMRSVLCGSAAAPARQVADRREAPRTAALDGARGPDDRVDQRVGRVVRVAASPGPGHRIAVTVERQLHRVAQGPVGGGPDRRAVELERERPGTTGHARHDQRYGQQYGG